MGLSSILSKFFGGSSSFTMGCSPFDSDEYVKNIYDSPSFTIAISKKISAVKMLEFSVFKIEKKNKIKSDSNVLNNLFNMVNKMTSWGDFLEYVMIWVDGKDNGILIEKISIGSLFTPQLKLWNPDNFVVYVNSGEISKIQIMNPTRTIIGEDLNNFLWIKQPNPENIGDNSVSNMIIEGRTKQKGVSLLGLFGINTWRWNNSLVKNSNTRPGIYTTTTKLGATKEKLLLEKIEGSNSLGNKGKNILVSGEMKYTPIDHSPKDSEWSSGDIEAHKRIAISLGVPAELVGSGDSTYSNRLEAKKELYEDTILPFARELTRKLNYFLREFLTNGEFIDFNTNKVPALQKNTTEIIKGTEVLKDRLTVNEYRNLIGELIDLDLENIENGDDILVSSTQTALSELDVELDIGSDDE